MFMCHYLHAIKEIKEAQVRYYKYGTTSKVLQVRYYKTKNLIYAEQRYEFFITYYYIIYTVHLILMSREHKVCLFLNFLGNSKIKWQQKKSHHLYLFIHLIWSQWKPSTVFWKKDLDWKSMRSKMGFFSPLNFILCQISLIVSVNWRVHHLVSNHVISRVRVTLELWKCK